MDPHKHRFERAGGEKEVDGPHFSKDGNETWSVMIGICPVHFGFHF